MEVARGGRGEAPTGTSNFRRPENSSGHTHLKGETIMGKHLNPLEKELLIRRFKGNPRVKLSDFCTANDVSDAAFRKWLKLYDAQGIEA